MFKFTSNNFLNKLFLFFLLFISQSFWSQNPALEFAAGDGNPTGNGPVTSSTVRFRNNTNNPTGTTFATYNPELTVTASLDNQQYNFTGIAPTASVVIGYANTASAVFPLMNAFGAPSNADYTGSGAATGTGINVDVNRAFEVQNITTPLRIANVPTNQRVFMADLVLTFSRAVNNPILHVSGWGGAVNNFLFSPEFNLQSSNVPVILSKLYGSTVIGVRLLAENICNIESSCVTVNQTLLNATGVFSNVSICTNYSLTATQFGYCASNPVNYAPTPSGNGLDGMFLPATSILPDEFAINYSFSNFSKYLQ